MSLKAQLEAIIYAAEEPVTLDQMLAVLGADIESELANEPPAGDSADIAPLVEAVAEAQEQSSGVAVATSVDQHLHADESAPAEKKKRSRTPDAKAPQRAYLRKLIHELEDEYAAADRGMEIREVAGGWRMSTKPEHHDVVRHFAKSLKPPVRLSLQALETLAVIAYKQPVTAPEISEIRGVDSSGVIATLMDRKLVTTAGRKQVIGRPILYRTTKDFLMRFGLKDISELPSMEEFEKMTSGMQSGLFEQEGAAEDAAAVNPDQPAELPTDHEREA